MTQLLTGDETDCETHMQSKNETDTVTTDLGHTEYVTANKQTLQAVRTRSMDLDSSVATDTDTDDTDRVDDSDTLRDEMRRQAAINVADLRQDEATDALGQTNDFKLAQMKDKTLEAFWTRAQAGSNDYRVIGGFLYRKAPPGVDGIEEFLLIVPEPYVKQVLEMAHDSTLGGHLGSRKTYNRIKMQFWFPKMLKTVRQHVKHVTNVK